MRRATWVGATPRSITIGAPTRLSTRPALEVQKHHPAQRGVRRAPRGGILRGDESKLQSNQRSGAVRARTSAADSEGDRCRAVDELPLWNDRERGGAASSTGGARPTAGIGGGALVLSRDDHDLQGTSAETSSD